MKTNKEIAQNVRCQTGENRLSKENCVILFIDHQTGLMQLVRDYQADEFRNNVLALADAALLFSIPVILTTSFEKGPNGPILPELAQKFSKAPYIARPGEINAWDNPDFVKAVKATGRKKLIIAGIVTDVCVALPALSALSEGFDVYIAADASGTTSKAVREIALLRLAHAGAIMTNWFSIVSEFQRDWRDHGEGLAKLLAEHTVQYGNLIESHKTSIKKN